ncbi:pyridoxamine 5'-phosphate oxidase family protein [Nocardia sp. X0981]
MEEVDKRVPRRDRPDAGRLTVELSREEAMALLASAPFGRIVFTSSALPAVRPVNHLVVPGGSVLVRTSLLPGLSVLRPTGSVIVAYQADAIDPQQWLGWSVAVTGPARAVTAPDALADYEHSLDTFFDSGNSPVIVIEPTLVAGIRLVERPQVSAG